METLPGSLRIPLILVLAGLLPGVWMPQTGRVLAQGDPYVVHETRPVILQGPYLVAPEEDGMTVVWITDTPCHSKILYGKDRELDRTAEPSNQGLLPVGTLHAIRLEGLSAGQAYSYRVVSTRVVKLQAYWPEKGLSAESAVYSFTTPDRRAKQVSFAFITDTQHEDVRRLTDHLEAVDWETLDFLAHGGDAVDWMVGEEHLFEKFLGPVSDRLAGSRPLVFARGNHDTRGPFARRLYDYLPTASGRFYDSFDWGPVHFLVLDTGEDKADDTNVYAALNRFADYREEEYNWFRDHLRKTGRVSEAPFRVLLMHHPAWGWVDGREDQWTRLANEAGVDLVIAGHRHRFSRSDPGQEGRAFTQLIVGQDQVATVSVSGSELRAVVSNTSREVVDSFVLSARNNP